MSCEVCGRRMRGSPVSVIIEGAIMNVCEECARFGATPSTWSRSPRKPLQRIPQREEAANPRGRVTAPVRVEGEEELVEGYGSLIREAREKMGLSQEELAKLVKEKVSVIKRVEAGRMEPPRQLASKLEKVLKIKLYGSEAAAGFSTTTKRKSLTLGDVVRLKD
ncbi:MAG: TIGR00270 family protein [Candidatus Freyarchaeota archaeon]|nr:TIGR00270 family protein [Candidatus Jordarchaeia archaeon]